jgi:hypothetical protein
MMMGGDIRGTSKKEKNMVAESKHFREGSDTMETSGKEK